MYGRGTVGGADLDTWNQWEAWQHRYMSTMEPGRAILTVYGVSGQCDLCVGEKDSYYKVLLTEYRAIFQLVTLIYTTGCSINACFEYSSISFKPPLYRLR